MLSDERLCVMAAAGDRSAVDVLLGRYRAMVRFRASGYFLTSGDADDLVQEGMVGLCDAIRDFRPGCGSSFRSFAELCVTREIITAVKTATRLKHGPLSNAVSLSQPIGEDDSTLADVLPGPDSLDPCDVVIRRETLRRQVWIIRNLATPTERTVAARRLNGLTLAAAGEDLSWGRVGQAEKTADNALQRLRGRLAA